MKLYPIFLAAAAVISSGVGAQASDARYEISITGYVPVVCNVQTGATAVPLSGSDVNLGSVNEFCNDPNGYQVWIDYAPGVTSASVSVDGTQIPLASSGSTMISQSATAARHVRQLSLSTGGDTRLSSISMRIVPL